MEPGLVSLEAGVLRITLNRVAKVNAFNPALRQGLAAGLDAWYNPLMRRMRALPDADRKIAAFFHKHLLP